MRGRGCLHATPCRTGHGTAGLDPAWPSRTAPVGASGVSRGLPGSRQSPSPRLVRARPEPGPLPSTGVTQLHRYYGPLRRLSRPSPEGDRCRVAPAAPTGLPCCQSPRAYVLRPLPRRAERSSRVGVSDRPRRPSSIERRLGARIQPFGACSGFTRVAARTLADPPTADLCPRGFDGSVTLAISWVATKAMARVTDPSKPWGQRSALGGSASVRAATRVKPEQAPKG